MSAMLSAAFECAEGKEGVVVEGVEDEEEESTGLERKDLRAELSLEESVVDESLRLAPAALSSPLALMPPLALVPPLALM